VGGSSQTPGDDYNYVWKTDESWSGCRELIVKPVDGSYHRALFNFRNDWGDRYPYDYCELIESQLDFYDWDPHDFR